MGKEIFIHLGLPKTGTTTLQNRIFHSHEDYLYLGKHNPGYTPNVKEKDGWILSLKKDLVCKDLPYFEGFNLHQILLNRFGEAYDRHHKLFLSEEGILDRCMTPGKYGNLIRIGSAYSVFNKMKILLKNGSFSSVKFILILRKQDDLTESFFAEEYRNFRSFLGIKSPAEFMNYLFKEGQMREIDSVLRYYSLVKHLDSLFGEENVLVLPYEKMKTDPETFLSEFSTFMQIRPWSNIQLIRENRDNNRDLEKKTGKIAKVQSLRLKMAQIKKRLIGDVQTGLGKRLEFIDKFQKDKIVELDELNKRKLLLKYAEENRKLTERVKYISEFDYY